MRIVKRILKITVIAVGTFIGFILLYLLAAYSLSHISVAEEKNAPDEVAIYLLTNGVHTDLVLPARSAEMDWTREIPFANTHTSDTTLSFMSIGWGDRGFYLETPRWADLKASVALKAATGLGASTMHATYYAKMTEDSMCRKIMISHEQYGRLVRYVGDSFEKDSLGHNICLKTPVHYSQTDAFYAAKGSYSMAHTCNTWVNVGLKKSGQKACYWTPFDSGIFAQYQ